MKIYYYLKTTPMRFHHFFKGVTGFFSVACFSQLIVYDALVVRFTWSHRLELVFDVIAGILLAVSFVGLHNLSTWGWLSTMAFCGLLAIYSIYRILLGLFYLSLPAADFLLPIFCLICAVAVALYYYPRRPLFLVGITFRKWSKKDTIFAPLFANRCRYCCHKYHPDDTDCPKCGRYIIPGL